MPETVVRLAKQWRELNKLERELDGVLHLLLNGLDDGGAGMDHAPKPVHQSASDELVTI